jgi:hypothetical protein
MPEFIFNLTRGGGGGGGVHILGESKTGGFFFGPVVN